MRVGHSYSKCLEPDRFRNTLDASVGDFEESLRVKERLEKIRSWSDFDQIFSSYWVKDFHRVLSQILVKQRRTLSIGSCFGENEAPFIRGGYDITCSDINADVVSHMQKIFGMDRYLLFDIFSPPPLKMTFKTSLLAGWITHSMMQEQLKFFGTVASC